jgi:very-short-patch-repair endonuclease
MFIGRIDMGYREWMIAVEYDGAFHWEQRRKDDRRRDRLRAAGWYVLVVSADDIYQRPGEVVAAVAAAIRDARRRTAGTAR